jgi:hypothetical protein
MDGVGWFVFRAMLASSNAAAQHVCCMVVGQMLALHVYTPVCVS